METSKTVGAFGRTLKMFRIRMGISQSALAEACKFDHSYVSRLEGGARDPSRNAVIKLARELNLSEVESDVLAASAGFTGENFFNIASEVEVSHILAILSDPDFPDGRKEFIRRLLADVALLADEVRNGK